MACVAFPFHGNGVGVSPHCHVTGEVTEAEAVGAVACVHKMPPRGYDVADTSAPPVQTSGQRGEAQPCPVEWRIGKKFNSLGEIQKIYQ